MERTPISISGKITAVVFLLFCLLFYQFYSASIISSLLMKPTKTINTLEKLGQTNLEVGMEPLPYLVDWFQTTNDPIEIKLHKKILGTKRKIPNYYSLPDGIIKVLAGGFAFVGLLDGSNSIVGSTWKEDAICDYTQIQMRPAERLFMAIPKESPFTQLFIVG